MAFQGKKRILYNIFQITGVLTLMNNHHLSRICCYFLVHDCRTSEDTYMKALSAHVAVDHNPNRFDNEFSE